MGESWYCRASPAALFEIPKPLRTKGMGVDQLPESVRNSTVLTGNNLGRLGNIETMPSEMEVINIKKNEHIQVLINQGDKSIEELQIAFHKVAQKSLEAGETMDALKILLLADQL